MKKENIGSVQQPQNGDFIVACLMCGEKKPVILFPHLKDGNIVGWVFLCEQDKIKGSDINVYFEKPTLPIQLAKGSPQG